MARIPTVAIIGRPNTGKSTLFNRLLGERRAIESPVAGTTRDRVAAKVEGEAVDYLLVDTAGIGGGTEDHELEQDVTQQSLLALQHCDLVLFTIDASEELTAADGNIVSILRKQKRSHVPVIIAANKCDNENILDQRIGEYHKLGIARSIIGLSASHGRGVGDLQDDIEQALTGLSFGKQERDRTAMEDRPPRIAIVGKPNVGKSSLINALMSDGERERSARIVSDIPGTTRDTSDTVVRHEGKEYIFVDTAGLRRKSNIDTPIEHYAAMRSIQAVEESDIVVLLLDATEELSRQDKRLARMAVDEGRGLVLALNKIDKITTEERDECVRMLRRELPYCSFAPIAALSAVRGTNIDKLFPLFAHIRTNLTRRIATKDLRHWYEAAVQRLPANALAQGKHVTQADEVPPTFVLFVRRAQDIQKSQLTFLERSLRELFTFDGVPIRFIVKGR